MERADGNAGLGRDHVRGDEFDPALHREACCGLTESDPCCRLLAVPESEFFSHSIEGTEIADLCNVAAKCTFVAFGTLFRCG
ncbi:hypothetical protein KAREA_03400 [Prescottella equi]|nr:hypothetical protein KAREA_03400 [Prescottella equi]